MELETQSTKSTAPTYISKKSFPSSIPECNKTPCPTSNYSTEQFFDKLSHNHDPTNLSFTSDFHSNNPLSVKNFPPILNTISKKRSLNPNHDNEDYDDIPYITSKFTDSFVSTLFRKIFPKRLRGNHDLTPAINTHKNQHAQYLEPHNLQIESLPVCQICKYTYSEPSASQVQINGNPPCPHGISGMNGNHFCRNSTPPEASYDQNSKFPNNKDPFHDTPVSYNKHCKIQLQQPRILHPHLRYIEKSQDLSCLSNENPQFPREIFEQVSEDSKFSTAHAISTQNEACELSQSPALGGADFENPLHNFDNFEAHEYHIDFTNSFDEESIKEILSDLEFNYNAQSISSDKSSIDNFSGDSNTSSITKQSIEYHDGNSSIFASPFDDDLASDKTSQFSDALFPNTLKKHKTYDNFWFKDRMLAIQKLRQLSKIKEIGNYQWHSTRILTTDDYSLLMPYKIIFEGLELYLLTDEEKESIIKELNGLYDKFNSKENCAL